MEAYDFLTDKTAKGVQWVTLSLKSLKSKLASSLYRYLKPKIDNPIIVIEWVLEMIWIPVKPALQAGHWFCDFMVAVKRQVKVGKKACEEGGMDVILWGEKEKHEIQR